MMNKTFLSRTLMSLAVGSALISSSVLFSCSALAESHTSAVSHAKSAVIQPKVLVVTMFDSEAKPWLEHEKFTKTVALPGLSAEYPTMHCTSQGVCLVTTAMGYANAASTMAAVALSSQLDLRQTYIIISGIGGVDPQSGTLGSANWAHYVVDGGLLHQIDARQIAADWKTGFFGLGAAHPGEKPKWSAGTEVFELNGALVNDAYALSKSVDLLDNPQAQKDRSLFPAGTAAAAKPKVAVCDTLSSDTFWVGSKIAVAMKQYAALLTDGKANVCTTQMEDNASLTALKRGASAGKLDFSRVLVLRTGSDFDQEAPGQTPAAALAANGSGYEPAEVNAYRVSNAVVKTIVANWAQWRHGPIAQAK